MALSAYCNAGGGTHLLVVTIGGRGGGSSTSGARGAGDNTARTMGDSLARDATSRARKA